MELPTVMGTGPGSGSATEGVAVTSYGQGQLSGVTYSVPAHGQIDVDFRLHLVCATPNDVKVLDALIRGFVDASKRQSYDDLSKSSVSGGVSFFGLFSGGAKASYEDTAHTMSGFGISAEDQQKIVEQMLGIARTTNDFNYKGTIFNKDFDYEVSGNLFGIVMDCTIQQGNNQNQVRFLAPNVHLQGQGGDDGGTATLPVTGKLY